MSMQWTGLNEHLIAKFYEVNHEGIRVDSSADVMCPFIDGTTLEGSFQWQSMGAETKAPMLAAMLQSGAIQPILNSLTTGTGTGDKGSGGTGFLTDVATFVDEFRGKTGITKLNSTQIFSGLPPIKISFTAVFRAFRDTVEEVERPYSQLWQWALPKHLAKDGVLANIIDEAQSPNKSLKGFLKSLMPSDAPTLIGLDYKGHTFAPMVIESITEPMDSPITKDGHYARLLIPMTISSLTALDKNDWIRIQSRSGE